MACISSVQGGKCNFCSYFGTNVKLLQFGPVFSPIFNFHSDIGQNLHRFFGPLRSSSIHGGKYQIWYHVYLFFQSGVWMSLQFHYPVLWLLPEGNKWCEELLCYVHFSWYQSRHFSPETHICSDLLSLISAIVLLEKK